MKDVYTDQPATVERPNKQPNYPLRRAMAGLALVGVVAGGAKAIEAVLPQSHGVSCKATGETGLLNPGESVWDKFATPLANELNTPVDSALIILSEANPEIDSLSEVDPTTPINLVECQPDK